MKINYLEAAMKMILEYAANVALINEVQFKKQKAVREQRFQEASAYREVELTLISTLPKSEAFKIMANRFKSEEEQMSTF